MISAVSSMQNENDSVAYTKLPNFKLFKTELSFYETFLYRNGRIFDKSDSEVTQWKWLLKVLNGVLNSKLT